MTLVSFDSLFFVVFFGLRQVIMNDFYDLVGSRLGASISIEESKVEAHNTPKAEGAAGRKDKS